MNSTLDETVLTLTVPGDLLSTTIDALRPQVSTVLQAIPVSATNRCILEIELRTTRLMDSAGVNFLVGILRACAGRDIRIRVRLTSHLVHRTLLFTRLDKHMELILED